MPPQIEQSVVGSVFVFEPDPLHRLELAVQRPEFEVISMGQNTPAHCDRLPAELLGMNRQLAQVDCSWLCSGQRGRHLCGLINDAAPRSTQNSADWDPGSNLQICALRSVDLALGRLHYLRIAFHRLRVAFRNPQLVYGGRNLRQDKVAFLSAARGRRNFTSADFRETDRDVWHRIAAQIQNSTRDCDSLVR